MDVKNNKKRWLQLVTVLALLLVLGPYFVSRLNSLGRRVRIHSTPSNSVSPTLTQDGLRIVSYNIAHGRGLAPSNWSGGDRATRLTRLDQISNLLIQYNADVVVLNEVDFNASWSDSVNQAKYLAEKAEYPYRVEQTNVDASVLHWNWRFGNAVLSRFPITHAFLIDLPDDAYWETILAGKKRGVVCDLEISDQPIRFIATHLSSRSEEVRVESSKILMKIASNSTLPAVVAGDLNSTPPSYPHSQLNPAGDNAIDLFDQSGRFTRSPQGSVEETSFTFPAVEPDRVIDWILIPQARSFQSYRVGVTDLSDHRPVIATLD